MAVFKVNILIDQRISSLFSDFFFRQSHIYTTKSGDVSPQEVTKIEELHIQGSWASHGRSYLGTSCIILPRLKRLAASCRARLQCLAWPVYPVGGLLLL